MCPVCLFMSTAHLLPPRGASPGLSVYICKRLWCECGCVCTHSVSRLSLFSCIFKISVITLSWSGLAFGGPPMIILFINRLTLSSCLLLLWKEYDFLPLSRSSNLTVMQSRPWKQREQAKYRHCYTVHEIFSWHFSPQCHKRWKTPAYSCSLTLRCTLHQHCCLSSFWGSVLNPEFRYWYHMKLHNLRHTLLPNVILAGRGLNFGEGKTGVAIFKGVPWPLKKSECKWVWSVDTTLPLTDMPTLCYSHAIFSMQYKCIIFTHFSAITEKRNSTEVPKMFDITALIFFYGVPQGPVVLMWHFGGIFDIFDIFINSWVVKKRLYFAPNLSNK